MNVGSLFSGIGGLDAGLARAGFRHAFFCESDPWRRSVLAHHWPGVPIYEDIRDVARDTSHGAVGEPSGRAAPDRRSASARIRRRKAWAGVLSGSELARKPERGAELPGRDSGSVGSGAESQLSVDLLTGGFPCQDVSVAGRRAGLAGERSGLFYEFARIAESLRPRWILVENVPGLLSSNGGRDFGAVIGTLADIGYGLAWRILDSRYFGVPQRRRRVFVLGALAVGDPRAAAERAGEILAVGSRCERHPATRGEERQDVALPLGSRTNNGRGGGTRYDLDNDTYVVNAMTAKWAKHSGGPAGDETQNLVASPLEAADGHHGYSSPRGDGADNLVAFNLRGREQGANPELDNLASLRAASGGSSRSYVADSSVRRLTPTECERLQALPDGWTDFGPDSRRYAALGDAVTASVSEWIGRRLVAA